MKKDKANSEEKEVKEAKEVKAQKNAETASSKAADKAPAEKNVTKVGSLLKEMRIQKGLKLPDIAKKLCIRRIYLEAIEESKTIDGITIHRTPGHHGFGQIGKMMGSVSGYVLTAEDCPVVYIMGDCRWEACTRCVVDTFNPDYIVVNSGGAVFPEYSITDGAIIPDEKEVMTMLDEIPSHIRLIAVHMDATDHGQTTRAILRNEALHTGVDMRRLLIPEDGDSVVL